MNAATTSTEVRMMRVEKAAKYLGVSTEFIYRQVMAGRLAHYKVGKYLEFTTSDLDAFRESRRREVRTRRERQAR